MKQAGNSSFRRSRKWSRIKNAITLPSDRRRKGSQVRFAALGYGARLLRPLFVRPAAWRVLDAFVGTVMLALAASLVLRALPVPN